MMAQISFVMHAITVVIRVQQLHHVHHVILLRFEHYQLFAFALNITMMMD